MPSGLAGLARDVLARIVALSDRACGKDSKDTRSTNTAAE
jgi:hypothetical protein